MEDAELDQVGRRLSRDQLQEFTDTTTKKIRKARLEQLKAQQGGGSGTGGGGGSGQAAAEQK